MAEKNDNKPVTFISRCPNLRIVKVPARAPVRGPGGIVLSEGHPGVAAEFHGGKYVTSDPDMIEYLRGVDGFNQFSATGGFWIDGESPREPRPLLRDQISAIAEAAAKGDIEGLRAVVKVENETHKRASVLEAAQAALDTIEANQKKAQAAGRRKKAASGDESDGEEKAASPRTSTPSERE